MTASVGPTESVDVVEAVRAGMRSPLLDDVLRSGHERSTGEAECMISERCLHSRTVPAPTGRRRLQRAQQNASAGLSSRSP